MGMELWLRRGEAWPLLEELLRARLGWPELPPVARTPQGKPWFPDAPEVHFNLSHSGGLALCGVGEAPLGVDVEELRPRRPGLDRYVLSDGEYAWYTGQGGGWENLYTLWTLKEARVKCTGAGLRTAPRDIRVPLLRPGETGELEGLRFMACAGPGWRGAVCTAGEEPFPGAVRQV